jgi:hypothetical protein
MTGVLNVIYINKSISECVDVAAIASTTGKAETAVCNLKKDSGTLILLLSVLTVCSCSVINAVISYPCRFCCSWSATHRCRAVCLGQSAAMFSVKIADMVHLKQQWAEHQRLEAEHAQLIAELETVLGPENAEVEQILVNHERRRASFVGDHP